MDNLIEDKTFEQIMGFVGDTELKIAITGNKGVFELYIPGLDARRKKQRIGIQAVLQYFTITQNIAQNKYEDKMMVTVTNHAISNKERTKRLLFGEDIDANPPWFTTSIIKLQTRAQLLASIAICGLIPGSRVAGYKGYQKASHRLFWLNHEDIYPYIRKHIKLTGNYQNDFLSAFYILWFKGTQDITGNDEAIKKVFLEEHINFFPTR